MIRVNVKMIDRFRLAASLLAIAAGGCGGTEDTPSARNMSASIPLAECRRLQPMNDVPSVREYANDQRAASSTTLRRPATIDRFANRDGKNEALSDFRCGRRLKIYTYVSNGVVPEFLSPGIGFCSPTWTNRAEAGRDIFRVMEAAAFHEGARRSEVEQALANSALRFSQAYNSTIFRLRKADIKAICPCAAPASAARPDGC